MFVGTNNMVSNFDNIRLNRLFLTVDQFNLIMKQTKEKQDQQSEEGENDDDNESNEGGQSGNDRYRFKVSQTKNKIGAI